MKDRHARKRSTADLARATAYVHAITAQPLQSSCEVLSPPPNFLGNESSGTMDVEEGDKLFSEFVFGVEWENQYPREFKINNNFQEFICGDPGKPRIPPFFSPASTPARSSNAIQRSDSERSHPMVTPDQAENGRNLQGPSPNTKYEPAAHPAEISAFDSAGYTVKW